MKHIVIFLLFFVSCKNQEFEQKLTISPPYFANEIPQLTQNSYSEKVIELGRSLFYDPLLSINGKVSCASCHHQALAFTDGVGLTQKGVSGKVLLRHAPSLSNLAWTENGLFWDGGAKNLESLVFAPLTHPDEMGSDLKKMIAKLQSHPTYPQKFQEAFGKEAINTAQVAKALAQFQRTLISDNSKYDQFIRSGESQLFSELELKGLETFEKKCSSCHPPPFFTDFNFHNNGLDSVFQDGHENLFKGRYRITLDSADIGKYKTPSLRNTAITAPYMHDGRFTSLEAVLDHYQNHIIFSQSLDGVLIQRNQKLGIRLNDDDKKAVMAFLHTLTDSSFIQNPHYSNPHVK